MKRTLSIASISLGSYLLSTLVGSVAYSEGQFLSTDDWPPNTTELFGPLHIINGHSGMCLTVKNASTANNAEVVQYECNYVSNNQKWYLRSGI